MLEQRPLGKTGLLVTPLCVGTSGLGGMPHIFGYEVEERQAVDTMLAVLDGPITFIDTSNGYAGGRSEQRIGLALRERGGLPENFVLATKVDPAPSTHELDGARVRRSIEESLERLGVDRFQLVYLHDPELHLTFEQATGPDGAIAALQELKRQGVVDHLGVAGGAVEPIRRYVQTGVFEVVLTHNRWTLVNSAAAVLMDEAAERGMAVVNAAVYGGGMLSKGPGAQPRYGYRPASEQTRDRVLRMQQACERFGVPLAAAALQYSTREPRISASVAGISAPERVAQTVALYNWTIPSQLWSELDELAAVQDAPLDS